MRQKIDALRECFEAMFSGDEFDLAATAQNLRKLVKLILRPASQADC